MHTDDLTTHTARARRPARVTRPDTRRRGAGLVPSFVRVKGYITMYVYVYVYAYI